MSEENKEVKVVVIDSMSAIDDVKEDNRKHHQILTPHSLHPGLSLIDNPANERILNMSEEEVTAARRIYAQLRPPVDYSLEAELQKSHPSRISGLGGDYEGTAPDDKDMWETREHPTPEFNYSKDVVPLKDHVRDFIKGDFDGDTLTMFMLKDRAGGTTSVNFDFDSLHKSDGGNFIEGGIIDLHKIPMGNLHGQRLPAVNPCSLITGRGMTDPENYVLLDTEFGYCPERTEYVNNTPYVIKPLSPELQDHLDKVREVCIAQHTDKTNFDLNMVTELVSQCTPENAEQVRSWYQGTIECGALKMVDEVNPNWAKEIDVLSTYPTELIVDEAHIDDSNGGVTTWGQRVAIVGGGGLAKASIMSALRGLEVEVTTATEGMFGNRQEYDMKGLSGVGTSLLLSGKHQSASPYAGGRGPRDNSHKEPRQNDRKAQATLNKKNGYGKRLTKRDKEELMEKTKDKYVERFVVERTELVEINTLTGERRVIKND